MKFFADKPRLNVHRSTVYIVIFIAAILSLLYLSFIAYRQLNRMGESEAMLRHSQEVRLQLEYLFSGLKDAESGQRGFIITRDSIYLKSIASAETKVQSTLLNLESLVSDNPAQILLLDSLESATESRMNILYSTLDIQENPIYNNEDLNNSLMKGFMAMEYIRDIIYQMAGNEIKIFESRKAKYQSFLRWTPLTYLLGVLFSLCIFTFSYFRIVRDRSTIQTANLNSLLQNQITQNAENNSLTGTYALDENRQPIYFSKNLLQLLGYESPPADYQRGDFAVLLDPEDTLRTSKSRDDLWSQSTIGTWNFKRSNSKGEVRHYRESAKVIERDKQKILVGSIQDITKDKLAEQNLESVIQQLSLQNAIYNYAETATLIGNCVWNFTKKKLTCSDNLNRHLGLGEHEKIESHEDLLTFLSPAERNRALQFFQHAIETRSTEPQIFTAQLKNGQVRFFRVSAAFATVQNEEFVIGTFQDVTSDVTLNERLSNTDDLLRKSNVRYDQMISEVEDYAIITLDKDGIIETWNKGAEKIKGYSEDEIMGQSISVFYTEEDRFRHVPQQLLETARKEGRVYQEGWRVRKDKSRYWGSTVITANHDNQKQVIGFTKVTRDLTTQKQLEWEQEKTRKDMLIKNSELERINSELNSFNHIVSHDLQEPLRKIQTFISLIEDDAGNTFTSASSGYFDRIQNSTGRMQNLIHDLITYSQMRTDQTLQKVDLNETLKFVIGELSIKIEGSKAVISVGPLPTIVGIPFQLEQLFANLIDNAIKYARPEVRNEIKIQSETIHRDQLPVEVLVPEQTFYHITIQDNGIGFDNQYAETIFTLFQRLHGKGEYSGTGIGLAICKRIMENHHGFVTAEGKLSKGAIFHLYFPGE